MTIDQLEYIYRRIPRVQPTNKVCPVCGVSMATRPLPDNGPTGQFFVTAQVGTLDNPRLVHGECMGGLETMTYYRWAAIQAYQKWKVQHG